MLHFPPWSCHFICPGFLEHVGSKKNRILADLDIAPDGTVYGVELLNANEQLTGDQGALIVESGGRRQKIPLVA